MIYNISYINTRYTIMIDAVFHKLLVQPDKMRKPVIQASK